MKKVFEGFFATIFVIAIAVISLSVIGNAVWKFNHRNDPACLIAHKQTVQIADGSLSAITTYKADIMICDKVAG